MHSKRKIPDSWRTGWKAKACTSFVLHLKVFKNHLYYLWHVRVLSIKPCLHTQLPEFNKSYRKVFQGWGHLIDWNGPMVGHLKSFSASGGRNLTKNFPKIQMLGGCPGGMLKLRFDWYIRSSTARRSGTSVLLRWSLQKLTSIFTSFRIHHVFWAWGACGFYRIANKREKGYCLK